MIVTDICHFYHTVTMLLRIVTRTWESLITVCL